MNLNKIKTKIVCTIGPSSWDQEVMRKMIEAGMNVARVNGAFADEAELDKVTTLVRNVSNDVALMMDVKGPEVRMNKFSEPMLIKPGQTIEVGNDESSQIYPANYKDLYKNLSAGQRIVIGDGDTELVIKEIRGDKMICEVVFGEKLNPGKAMNLPGANFATSALTQKDIINLKHSIGLGWDFVSASFIQNAASAREIREYLNGSQMKLIAKIEDQQGVDNIDEILCEVDGIMVARGGLGVELGLENVPMVQRYLIEKANRVGKPVITATQMLESMIHNPRPTRAEANDVATAITLGSDAVMLSGESSAGKFPIESVEWLARIARAVEGKYLPQEVCGTIDEVAHTNLGKANNLAKSAITVAESAVTAAKNLDIKTILVMTKEGFTARLISSRYKVAQEVIAFVPDEAVKKRLSITGGVHPIIIDEIPDNPNDLVNKMIEIAKYQSLVNVGDLVAVVIGLQILGGAGASTLELIRVR